MASSNGQRWVWLALLVVCFAVAPFGEYRPTFGVEFIRIAWGFAPVYRVACYCGAVTLGFSTTRTGDHSTVSNTQALQAEAAQD
jgi:hypothetical protein